MNGCIVTADGLCDGFPGVAATNCSGHPPAAAVAAATFRRVLRTLKLIQKGASDPKT